MGNYKQLPKRVSLKTKPNTEGFGISYSEEVRIVNELLRILPTDYAIEVTWCQVLLADVQWYIDHEEKKVVIAYNQNLRHWQPHLVKAIYQHLVEKYGEPEAKARKRGAGRNIRILRQG